MATGWSSLPARRPARTDAAASARLLLLIPLVLGLLGAPGNTAVVQGDELADAKAKQAAAQEGSRRAEGEGQGAQLAPGRARRRDPRDPPAAQRDRRRPRRGPQEDHQDGRPDHRGPEGLRGADRPGLGDGRRAAPRHRQGSGQARGARRAPSPARRPRPQRLRHRPHVAARDVAVGRDVHRPARRDELLHRRRRAGQGARRADHQGQGSPRRVMRETVTRDPRSDRRPAPGDGRAEARARSKPHRAQGDARRAQEAREGRGQGAARAAGPVRGDRAQQGQRREGHHAGRGQAEGSSPARSTSSSRSRSTRATSRREYNGTFRWPMDSFNVSGEYGCSSFSWYAPGNGCAHYHNGIDMVAPYGTKVRAAGAGTVVYVGWNWADGADPAWIVVIAHSSSLRTWYAHMQPKRPVSVGEHGQARARSSGTRATPATRPARTSTGWSRRTATS